MASGYYRPLPTWEREERITIRRREEEAAGRSLRTGPTHGAVRVQALSFSLLYLVSRFLSAPPCAAFISAPLNTLRPIPLPHYLFFSPLGPLSAVDAWSELRLLYRCLSRRRRPRRRPHRRRHPRCRTFGQSACCEAAPGPWCVAGLQSARGCRGGRRRRPRPARLGAPCQGAPAKGAKEGIKGRREVTKKRRRERRARPKGQGAPFRVPRGRGAQLAASPAARTCTAGTSS